MIKSNHRKKKKRHTSKRKRSSKRKAGVKGVTLPDFNKPTLVIPPRDLLFGQPTVNNNNYKTSRRWRYRNKSNPFSRLNYQKTRLINKYIKNQVNKRNRTLRLKQFGRIHRARGHGLKKKKNTNKY